MIRFLSRIHRRKISLILPGLLLLAGIPTVQAAPTLHGLSPDTGISLLGDVSRKKRGPMKLGRIGGKRVLVNAGCGGCGFQTTVHDNAFRFLALHQNSDGSWNHRHPNCLCPRPRLNMNKWAPLQETETVATKEKVSKLVSRFQEESIEAREEAASELKKLGLKAIPGLLRGIKNGDAETSARCRSLVQEVQSIPEMDYTPLALLAYLGSGNTHRDGPNKEEVTAGMKHLILNQSVEGRVGGKRDLNHIIGTIAICEDFRRTKTASIQPRTEKAVAYLGNIWARTPRMIAWKGLALRSATLAGIEWRESWLKELEAVPLTGKDPWSWVAKRVIKMIRGEKITLDETSPIFTTRMDKIDPELLYLINVLVYRYHPRGKSFSDWKTRLKGELKREENKDQKKCNFGSWRGETYNNRLQRTIFRVMTLHLYYRFANTLARNK